MRNEKLIILLKNNFIRINDFISDEMEFSYEGEYYLINKDVESILETTFKFYLELKAEHGIDSLEREIKVNESLMPTNKESKINILNKLILRENENLINLIGSISQFYNVNTWLGKWKNAIVRNGESTIDLIYGLMIEAGKDQAKIAYSFYEYFYNAEIEKIFEIYSTDENIKYLKRNIDELINLKSNTLSKQNITAPTIALFCSLIHDSGLIKQENESAPSYCEKVCAAFNLIYRDRVRQNYTSVISNYESKEMQKVKKQILPLLDVNYRKKLTNHLESKKLYA